MDKASRNRDAVTKRILETTQETERLKQELQNLIAAGISGTNYNISTSRANIPIDSTNKVQIIKSYDPKHSQHIKKPPEVSTKGAYPSSSKHEALSPKKAKSCEALSPKKPKTYDVHQAREYIKKQRDKRKEDVKSKTTETKLTVAMRKEKLQELQQKASELVKKNVEAKRQRSKSRERIGASSTNESVIVGFNCAERTKNHLEQPIVNQFKPHRPGRDPNLLYPPEPAFTLGTKHSAPTNTAKPSHKLNTLNGRLKKYRGVLPLSHINRHRGIAHSKHSKSLQNLLKPPEPHYGEPSNIRSNKSSENISKKDTSNEQKVIAHSNITLRTKGGVTSSMAYDLVELDNPHQDIPFKSHNSSKNYIKQKSTDQSQAQLNSTENTQKEHNNELFAPVDDHLLKESPNKKKLVVLSNITLKRPDETPYPIEHQKEKMPTPEWLKDTMGQGDPYNFINTVKRQLKFVVNEKKPLCVDVAVQGNLEDNISEPKTGDISKKIDLKSFISHKCLNLDPNIIQHIELDRRNNHFGFKDGPTITNRSLSSDCDSDTSKNIPSLSSESGTSLRRNAEFVKQSYVVPDLKPKENAPPNLDTEKVDNIKLKKPSKPSESEVNTNKVSTLNVPLHEDIQRIKKQLFRDSDSYSSDFIPTNLEKSRNSLVSFNCAKVSPNRVPDYSSNSEKFDTRSVKSNSKISTPTGTVTKKYSQSSESTSQGSQRNSGSLNSLSDGGSQKINSQTNQFLSLHSELNPSTIDQDLKVLDQNIIHTATSELSSSGIVTSEQHSRTSDGFTDVLKPKKLYTDSSYSQDALPKTLSNDVSERTNTVLSLKISEKSANKVAKSKSEPFVSNEVLNKRNGGRFSKSGSDICENKENMKEMSLKQPKLSLKTRDENIKDRDESRQALIKNISIRSGNRSTGDINKTNEVHLKFEAEIHLLNDFNQSLKQFSEIEKAFESIRSRNDSEMMTKKVLHNRDTQTSIITKTSTRTVSKHSDRSSSQISTINYSRGSGNNSQILSDRENNAERTRRSEGNLTDQENNFKLSELPEGKSEMLVELTQASDLNSLLNTINLEDTELGNVSERTNSVLYISEMDEFTVRSRGFNDENLEIRNFAAMSLRMFDQLIKDEDARIANCKNIVKIRERTLLDRTRGELLYLEMQKKQLIETGKMAEASLIKKKQRGILLKLQQEKLEMQRLRQMQQEASTKRKTLLKREKNLIKNQLLSDNMLSKLKPSSHRERHERRLSGPLRGVRPTGSETALSKEIGRDQEIKNVTSRTCTVQVSASENLISDIEPLEVALARSKNMSAGALSSMKQRLLMREHALANRRKTVEELLQWHKKLLEEEKAIEDLESKVENIISKIPSESNEEPSNQPVDLSKSVSDHTLSDLNTPSMSQVVLDSQLPSKETVKTNSRSLETSKNIPQEENFSEDSNKLVSSANYSTDFDVDSVPEVIPQNSDDQSDVSSLSQLIENFSKIEDNILNLNLQKRQSLESEGGEVTSVKSESARTVSSATEDIIPGEEKSEASSHSNQISSEVEVKRRDRSPIEFIEIEEQEVPVEDNEESVVIVKDPREHFIASPKGNRLVSLVEEIKENEDTKKDSEEFTTQPENNSESLPKGQSDSEHVPKSSLIVEELYFKETPSELLSVSEEDKIVPDDSNRSSLRDDAEKVVAEEQSTSIVMKVGDDAEAVCEELSAERNREESLETGERTTEDEEEQEVWENIVSNVLIDGRIESQEEVSVNTLEDAEKTSKDVVASVGTVEACTIHEESKPSTSHQKTAESIHLLSTQEGKPSTSDQKTDESSHLLSTQEGKPSTSDQKTDESSHLLSIQDGKPSTSDQKIAESNHLLRIQAEPASHKSPYVEDERISIQILSEEPPATASKSDVPTSKQYEQTEEHAASNVDISSTSPQTEEQATTSQILSLTKDEVSDPIEERESHGNSSISTPSIIENDVQSSAVIEDERQSFENKTDEEKVASLSIKASGIQSGLVSEDRSRPSGSTTRASSLATQEPSVSSAKSIHTSNDLTRLTENLEGSVASSKPLTAEVSAMGRERLTEASASVRTDQDSDNKDTERLTQDHSKINEIDSVIQEKSLSTGESSKISLDKGDKASSSSGALKVTRQPSIVQEKSAAVEEKTTVSSSNEAESVEAQENQSEPSLVETVSVSAQKSPSIEEASGVSATKSTISSQKSVSSEKPSKSSAASKEKSAVSSKKSSSTSSEKSPRSSLDVKKRVQEILSEASPVSRGDKSPRMQDLCVMTYDLISPTRSPEAGSPLEEKNKSFSLGSEAEELLRKQLAIEQEIKLLTEQQHKEQASQFYIREIPNKPPPPYTPPSKAKTPKTPSLIPSSKEEIEQITEYSAKIIHKAYLSNNLDNISISDNTLNLIAKNIDKGCYKYVFDLCKEVAIGHYSQFTIEAGPSWLQLEKKVFLAPSKPLDVKGLKRLMNKKLLELFGLEKQEVVKENAIMKWSRKKRDHVDEVLVQEMQAEEGSWTNFDRDELMVKDRITNEIMEMLLKETAQVLRKTVQKKSASQ